MDVIQVNDINSNQRSESDESDEDGEDERMVVKVVVLSRENVEMPDGLCNILLDTLNQALDETGGTMVIRATLVEEPTSTLAVVDLYEARHPTQPVTPTYLQLYMANDPFRDRPTSDAQEHDMAEIVFFLTCFFMPAVVLMGIILRHAV